MSLKHLVVFLMVNCVQDTSCNTVPLPMKYILSCTYPSSCIQFPTITSFFNTTEGTEYVETSNIVPISYMDKRVVKGTYQKTRKKSDPEDFEVDFIIPNNFSTHDLSDSSGDALGLSLYTYLPNFLNSKY